MIKEQGNELQEAQIIADFESCHFFSHQDFTQYSI